MVLDACPDVIDWARHGISSWRDLMATAGNVRSALGISPSAWEDACAVLGEEDAAVVVAAILQRADAIKSPGGYLRCLTEKARAGQFSLGPVLMALLRSRPRERARVA
jgi:replication initiation protein RepC